MSPKPLPLRQPVPDVVTIRDLLIETALQSRVTILDLTTHVPGQRSVASLVQARTAFVVVARDALGYQLPTIARFLNRPVTSVAHLATETAPRLARVPRYQALVRHLDLFARGLPTTRLDLAQTTRSLPKNLVPRILSVSLSAKDKLLRIWLVLNSVRHTESTLVTVSDLERVARDVGCSINDIVRLLARLLDMGVLSVHTSDERSVTYALHEDAIAAVVDEELGERQRAMEDQLRFWMLHRHVQSTNPCTYWPIHQTTFQQIDMNTTCDAQTWNVTSLILKALRVELDSLDNAPILPVYDSQAIGEQAGVQADRLAAEVARAGWNRMAERHGLERVPRLNAKLSQAAVQRMRDLHGAMNWELYMERVGRSSYLTGANPFGFVVSFKWVLTRSNMVAVLAGVYDDGQRIRLTKREQEKVRDQSIHRDRQSRGGPGDQGNHQRGAGGQFAGGADRALSGPAGTAAGEDDLDQGLRVWHAGGPDRAGGEGVEVLRHGPVAGAHLD